MVYVALTLIFFGLLGLLYVVLSYSVEKSSANGRESQTKSNSSAPRITANPGGVSGQSIPRVDMLSPSSPTISNPPLTSQIPGGEVGRHFAPSSEPRITKWETESQRSFTHEEENPKKILPPLQIQAVYYQDQSRRLPGYAKRPEDFPTRFFQEFIRIGQGSVKLSASGFEIEVNQSKSVLSTEELDQILFFDSGFALVPLSAKPIPVFLTKETQKVKDYVRSLSAPAA